MSECQGQSNWGGGGGGCGENKGILYNVMSRLSNKELEMDDFLSEVESEIVLDMTRVGDTGTAQGEGVSGSCSGTSDLSLALISEWMFLRAFRWWNTYLISLSLCLLHAFAVTFLLYFATPELIMDEFTELP